MAKQSLDPASIDVPTEAITAVLPWYANHSLPEAEQQAVEDLIRRRPAVAGKLASWQQVRAAALSQPQRPPASAVRQRLLAQTRTHAQPRPLPRWLPALSGIMLAVLTLAVLWNVVQPGIGLQWSVNGSVPSAFRVYRAPFGSDQFELVREVPARDNTLDYSFIDTTLWPGQTYQYRIEAINQEMTSATVAANGADILPAQFAIVISSLMIGLAAAYALRQVAVAPPSAWRMA